MSGRMLIVSGGDLLVKGYQAVPADRRQDDGRPVNALFGVVRSIARAIASKAPERAVAVIDPERPHPWPDLAEQRARLPLILRTLGLTVVPTTEELQVVAAYVRAATDAGDDVVVVGSDKRLAQLVSDGVWWHDAYKDARYTPSMVVKRFGVGPDRVADWLALVGDDGELAGIKGIGKKSATALLERFGTVERAHAEVETLDTRTRNAMKAGSAEIPAALAAARLCPRPLPTPLDALAFELPDRAAVNAMYAELGFFELLSTDRGPSPAVTVCRDAAAVAAAVTAIEGSEVGMHVLTEDPSPVRGAVAGIAVTTDAERFYFPLADAHADPRPLVEWLEDPNQPKVAHETATVYAAFARRGIRGAGFVGDSASASHLVEPSNLWPHDLPFVARQMVRRALPTEDDVRGVGSRRRPWSKVDPVAAGGFAAAYGSTSAAVWAALRPRVEPELHAEYLALSETVARMAVGGIGVDGTELDRVGEDFRGREVALEREIFEHAGRSFNVGSSKQLGDVLFQELKLTVMRRTKTGWSTATDALERIQHEHPIVPLVVRWRALQRMRNTWITSLKACIDADGRVRSTFHPARSFSGRLVNSHPDLGRVPGRTDEMQRIRRAFVAPEGRCLVSVDYRQLGLFVLAHLTGDPALVEPLRRDDDMHVLTAAAVLDVPETAVTADQRQLGKVVNFATFAGQGASALAQQLAVGPQEAKRIIERFDRRYSVVRAFQEEQLRLARDRGYIVTVAGRRWPIGGLASRDPQDLSYAERLARRATHEGSVADVSRRGLLRADQALRAAGQPAFPLLQIHDEVLFEAAEDRVSEAAAVAAEAMATAFELRVPLRVGIKAGQNWADMAPIEIGTPGGS